MKSFVPFLLLLAVATSSASTSDDDSKLSGHVEFTYRDVGLGGNQDKYREDVNLDDDAFRLSDLHLEVAPEAGFFDHLLLEANGLGGEPHKHARFGLSKTDRYDLDINFRETEYFYRDAGYFFRDGGDLYPRSRTGGRHARPGRFVRAARR